MNKAFKASTRRAVGLALFRGLNIISLISLVFYSSLLGVLVAPLSTGAAEASSGAIWTNTGPCGTPQNVNEYNVGDEVFIHGSNFDPGTYDWDITGQPNSGDPSTTVASGTIAPDQNGAFCFSAYIIQPGDDGVYKYGVGNKNDNYHVNGVAPGSLQLTKVVDSGSASADDFSFSLSPDPNGVGTVHTTSGTYTFTDLPAGSYTITESAMTDYHQVSTTCENVSVAADQQATCVIHNARDTGSLIVHKGIDTNGDGTYEGNDTEANAIFQWGLDAETPARNFGTTAANIATGAHTVTENTLSNYQFTSWYYGGDGTSNICGNNEVKYSGFSLPADVSVANNETTVITLCNSYIQTPANVSISKTDNDETANPGDTQHYVITLTNDGDQAAFGVKVTDTLPAHVASVSAISDGGIQSSNTIIWNNLTVPGHGTKTVSFDATLDTDFEVGTTVLTNHAALGCGVIEIDTDEANIQGCLYEGSATDTTSVTVNPREPATSNVSGLKFNDLNANGSRDGGEPGLANWKIQLWTTCDIAKADYNGDGKVTLSDAVLFTTPYLGGDMAADIHIDSDVNAIDFECMKALVNLMPSDGSWVVIAEQTTDASGNYSFTGLTPGDYRVTEVMQAGWNQTLPGTPNYFYATSLSSSQSVIAMDFGNATDPGLTITKTDNQTTATAGQVLTYQVNITNSGDTTATNVKVTDTLPSYITTVNAISDGGSQVGTAINWSNLSVAGHTTKTLTYNVTVDPNLGLGSYVVHNVVTLGCGSPIAAIALVPCGYTGTATDDTSVTVAGQALLTIEKSANVTVANPGNTITYTVKVTNNGTVTAVNVLLTDVLPKGFTTLDSGADQLILSLGSIAPGASVSTTYQTSTSLTLTDGAYTNVAIASAGNATSVSDDAAVTLLTPEVLGAETPGPEVLGAESLPDTGTGMIDYVVALFGIMALGMGLRLTRPIKE